jgi:hypothetical protein
MKECLMRPQTLILPLLIAGSLGLGLSTRAEEDPLNMQVAGYEKLPVGAKFRIRPNQNTELTNYAQARLKEALERHGFSYGGSARLVMTIAAEKIGSERPPAASFDQNSAQFHVSIGNSPPPLYAQVGHEYRISLDLYDRQSGRYLWRGQISDLKPDADPFTASKSMIERLITAMAVWAGQAD